MPGPQVIGCVVHAACSRPEPDRGPCSAHADKLILGEPRRSSERVAALARRSSAPGSASNRSANVRRAIWYKLWGNATINPLSALTRATADRLLADPHLRAFMLDAMAELAAVGAAIGCPISESGEDRMAVTARLGAFKASMLQDVEAGRPIELEALLGAPREIAARAGIPTPQLDCSTPHPADGREPRPALAGPGTTRPTHSPKPDAHRALAFAPGAQRHFVAVLEEAARLAARQARSAACRRWLISSSQPRPSSLSVEMVPVPIRSPGWRLQPLEAWWATICAASSTSPQSALPRDSTCGAMPLLAHRLRSTA